ncbi:MULTISPECIES: ASCH domain-containing protein [unclassified Shewanella]|uniref:ASCH domain-containing protein n=1 Tax=unclassified Shewanella TaxID=196818 RepID=UPI0021D9C181|nr:MULTISPECIES: ASCH domain-containing protein [unclassified Shewanella]MCU8034407.1 ASCH domain-containing protein [Shewanella sp. SM71]MCU8096114.1 ASCH domain-containing protein [Shewanella sp. SM102]
MKQRPIIFNTEMVQAIVDGRKTQTRRQMNPQPKPDTETSQGGYWFPCAAFQSMVHVEDFQHPFSRGMASDACPICSVGDQLYVRETFADCGPRLTYKADKDDGAHCVVKRWTPSIHMPRSCARIILEVTNVRVERVQHISERDAWAEGFEGYDDDVTGGKSGYSEFCEAWQSIYGEQSWQSNPWVWVIEFKVISTTGGAA